MAAALAFETLAGDVAALLARLPAAAGVGQILGPEGRSLVVGMPSNLRAWAASHLGQGKPPAAGRRPKTNLAPIATAVGFAVTEGSFRQRLLFERVMAPLVPLSARRDLKPPVFLHLDPEQRFPRVSVRGAEGDPAHLFGPFRDRRAAEKARDVLHKLHALRPCDYAFEPHPELPLGIACLYAQVRSCAAPCLGRSSEDEYRALAARAAAWLASPGERADAPAAVPATVAAASARALVVDPGRREIGLVPVRAGRVLDRAIVSCRPGELEQALAALRWDEPGESDDWRWLASWLRASKARASWLHVRAGEEPSSLAARVRAGPVPPRIGDNVETSRGRA